MTLSEKLRELIDEGQAWQTPNGLAMYERRCCDFIDDHGPDLLRALEDAERYRVLRNRDKRKDHCLHCGYDGLALFVGEELDAAIDQARQS